MLLTINYVVWKEEFQTIKILFELDLYHRYSGNERHFKKDDEFDKLDHISKLIISIFSTTPTVLHDLKSVGLSKI